MSRSSSSSSVAPSSLRLVKRLVMPSETFPAVRERPLLRRCHQLWRGAAAAAALRRLSLPRRPSRGLPSPRPVSGARPRLWLRPPCAPLQGAGVPPLLRLRASGARLPPQRRALGLFALGRSLRLGLETQFLSAACAASWAASGAGACSSALPKPKSRLNRPGFFSSAIVAPQAASSMRPSWPAMATVRISPGGVSAASLTDVKSAALPTPPRSVRTSRRRPT